MKKELDLVKRYQKELTIMGQANALLNWDEETYMPKLGIGSRAEQTAFLSKIAHDKMTSNEFFGAIRRLKGTNLDGENKIMVDKLYKDVSEARKIPNEFIEELSRTTTLASSAWRDARKKNDFKIFEKHLDKIIRLKRKQAYYVNLPGHPYNSLLDSFEEGMNVEKIQRVFTKLKEELIHLLRKIKDSEVYRKQKVFFLNKKFDREIMSKFLTDVSRRMGLKNDFFRIDISEHPFTTKIGFNDIRITTNFRKDPLYSFFSSVHEAGHALYEAGMPAKHQYDVLGDAPSFGIHESQSRLWENAIARSKAFWRYYLPKFNREFKMNSDLKEWYKEINLVKPGLIRVEADEVHYCLHVILRFELEVELIGGKVDVKDLPKIWNSKTKEVFGVEPRNDVEGVLQDVHWSQGYIGYFPTYAIGSIYYSQIYNTLKKEINLDKELADGDYTKISKWLKENIHDKGSKYLADDIIKKAVGEGLNHNVFIDYLTERYKEIYEF